MSNILHSKESIEKFIKEGEERNEGIQKQLESVHKVIDEEYGINLANVVTDLKINEKLREKYGINLGTNGSQDINTLLENTNKSIESIQTIAKGSVYENIKKIQEDAPEQNVTDKNKVKPK